MKEIKSDRYLLWETLKGKRIERRRNRGNREARKVIKRGRDKTVFP